MFYRFLLINGKSLNLIMQDSYLMPHFTFIASLSHNLLGYNLNPINKKNIDQHDHLKMKDKIFNA